MSEEETAQTESPPEELDEASPAPTPVTTGAEVAKSAVPPPSKELYPLSYHENDGLGKYGGRDLWGYGSSTPSFTWTKKAKVALSFVINFEEGESRSYLAA
jgi:hypothetical protein